MSFPRGRFVWYDLMTTDADAAKAFYTSLIGWGTEKWDGPAPYTMWMANDTSIGGVVPLPDEAKEAGAPPHWLSYIATPHVDETVSKSNELGGKVIKEAMDIPTVGRFAVLADPQGAAYSAFTPESTPPGHDGAAKLGEFSWHELMTTDYEAAFGYYSELFGWDKKDAMDMGEMGMYQMYGRPGFDIPLGGMFKKPPEVPAPAWLYYIRVEDVRKGVEKVKELGGKVLNGPMEVPGGDLIATCMDPQGAAFAIHHTKQ